MTTSGLTAAAGLDATRALSDADNIAAMTTGVTRDFMRGL
jgi:hypothetical protein